MGYIEEIKIREALMKKVTTGIKLQKEENMWLMTHCLYNAKLGYPYLNSDIIKLCPNVLYDVYVSCESLIYPYSICPIIGVADMDGEIITDFELKDFYGKKDIQQRTKMLGLLLNEIGEEKKFKFKSKMGLMTVAYECEYYVNWLGRTIKESSNTGKYNFAMIKKSNNGIFLYECKDPNSDDFNIFSFSIRINQSRDG